MIQSKTFLLKKQIKSISVNTYQLFLLETSFEIKF